jgi:hypothetical protein
MFADTGYFTHRSARDVKIRVDERFPVANLAQYFAIHGKDRDLHV